MKQLEKGTIMYKVIANSLNGKVECNTMGIVIRKLDSVSYEINGYKVATNRIYNDKMIPAPVSCPVQLSFNAFVYCAEDDINAAKQYIKESYNLTILERQKELSKLLLDCNVII